jgi:hypothetical protein
MFRVSAVLGAAILGMACLVGTSVSQDAKKDPPKTKGYLPPGWKALGLSKDQSSEISKIHGTYKSKIAALQEQIDGLKIQERQEMVKLLTDEQKDKLRKLILPDEAKDKKADAAKDTVKDTAKDKK